MNIFRKLKSLVSQKESTEKTPQNDKKQKFALIAEGMNKENVNGDPEFVIVMGAICSGKTTFRKENYADGYVNIDAGEIFLKLSQGEYYNFPSHLEEEMNYLGLTIIRRCWKERRNIVVEIIGSDEKSVRDLIEAAKLLGYSVKGEFIHCEKEVALKRLEERNEALMTVKEYNSEHDNISAYFCEPYHISWFLQIADEYYQAASEYLSKKEKTTFSFKAIDANIWQLSNDEEIKNFSFRNSSLREMYEVIMANPSETRMCASLFDTHIVDKAHPDSLFIIIRYETSTQLGQLDLFMIENPVSKETNFYKVISYLEKSMDRNKNDLIDYLRTVLQNKINKNIKVMIDKTSHDGLSTENNLIYFSYS